MEYAEATTLDFLRDNMPAKLVELRTRYGTGDPVVPLPAVKGKSNAPFLPAVREWGIGSPTAYAVGEYPAITVSGMDSAIRPLDGDSYRVTYRLRVFAYVREQELGLVHDQRNRLVLAVRELTLAAPGFQAVGGRLSVVRERLVESYSDVVDDGAGRSLAGAYTELFVAVSEDLDRGPLAAGTPLADIAHGAPAPEPGSTGPNTLDITVRPAHPALD